MDDSGVGESANARTTNVWLFVLASREIAGDGDGGFNNSVVGSPLGAGGRGSAGISLVYLLPPLK